MTPSAVFSKKINKIDKRLDKPINKKREVTQINKIRNEGGEITTNITEIQNSEENTTNGYMPKNWTT